MNSAGTGRVRGRGVILLAAAAVTAIATSQSQTIRSKNSADSSPPSPHELRTSRDLYVPATAYRMVSPPMRIGRAGNSSVQANVGAGGMNIVGDAANEPSIAVDPTAPNRMAVGWRQFNTTASSFRQAGWSYTVDGGRTWAAMDIIEPGIFRSDPVLGADADGTFYYLSLEVTPSNQFFCDMFISADGGRTWPQKGFAYGGDKAWFAIDSTGGTGDGNVYQGWNIAGNQFAPNQFNRSAPNGLSWESPVEYEPEAIDPARPVFGLVAVHPDGSVYVAGSLNQFNSSTFWVVRSSNAQDINQVPTFDQVTPVDLGGSIGISTGPNPGGLLGQIEIDINHAAGPHFGEIYVLCSLNPPGDDPMDVHFIRSTDGGLTFSPPIRVNDDVAGTNAWQWFGAMSVAPNGRIDVIWYDTRASGLANVSELYYASSSDGGQTWSANVALSPAFNTHVGFPVQQKIGDYIEFVSDNVGADVIYSATFNGEQDVYYLRINDYDCNKNGVGDGDDLVATISADCNENDIPDECEIAAGARNDVNANGVPDECDKLACPGDVPGVSDDIVNVSDLLAVLAGWGPCPEPCPPSCPADVTLDCQVNVFDLLAVLAGWGSCD